MRLILIVLVVVTFLVPPAAAATCVPSCSVYTSLAGYASPVTVVESGAAVTWIGSDVSHTATADAMGCFSIGIPSGLLRKSSPITLTLNGTNVDATVNGVTKTCAGTALPDGTVELGYRCAFHAAMRAALVVT